MKNKQTGITLIALVITIVILLILAGITINSLGGENGILAKAKWSAYVSEYESVAEAKDLYRAEREIDKYSKETISYEIASTSIIIAQNSIQDSIYPVDLEKPLESANISGTLKKTIMDLEGLQDNEINDIEKVNLYQVDFTKINAEAKKDYVINIVNGNLYSLQYEEYNGNFYHTPRLGVAIIENKMEEPGNYEIIVDAGDTVSWDSIQIAYKEFVENSLTCKIYTSDDEVNWKEQNLELVNYEGQIEKYNISTADNSQFLKIRVEIKSVNGNNSKVDYLMTNFYKFRDTGIVPEVTVEGAQKQNGVYSIPTPSNGQTEATGTASVVQKIVVPNDGEFLLELEDVYGSPNTTVKITKADGTEETINIADSNKISVPAGATVEVTTQLEAGDGIGEIKVLKKDSTLSQEKIEDNTKTESGQAGWVTVEQNQYVYNNGGTGFWEKCLVNNVEVDETGIIIESEDVVKRIKIRYQASDGITWSSTFSNIQDARNAQYLKVIVEYQVIEGNEYGDTSNNSIKVILNDGSWTATFVDEDGTELFNKYVYFENNSMQGSIELPKLTKVKEGKCFVGWKIGDNNYRVGESYTLTKDETFIAVYEDLKITTTTPIINTTTTATTSVEDNSQSKGTILYINFSATLNDGTECTIVNKDDNKAVPYEITHNGTYTFTATMIYNGETITEEIEVIVNKYETATDLVQYDAGTWTQAEIDVLSNSKLYDYNESRSVNNTFKLNDNSGLNFTFGGFKAGDSRNNSITPMNGYGIPKYDGWRILESEEKDGKTYVTKLVHAGTPENFVYKYTISYDGYRAEYLLTGIANYGDTYKTLSDGTAINVRNWDMYKDKDLDSKGYIKEVHAMTYDEAYSITNTTGTTTGIRNTGSYYFLGSNYGDAYHLWTVLNSGDMTYFHGACWGARPVVSLQSGVYIASGTGVEGDPYILGKD